jgi:uncharacterized membrane protein
MKNWLKEYKWKIVLSMVLTMLPMLIGLLLWNRLPDVITTHWGGDGVADGFSGKAFAVFALPAMMAGFNILCCLVTALDPKQAKQNKKAMGLVFWIMPIISVCVCTFVYSAALGKTVDMFVLMPLLLGVMFVWIGNYLPKVQQNSTLGIKIYWTLHNEENWNRTHRFAGKVSVAGGIVTMLSAMLPVQWMIAVMVAEILVIVLAPTVYSYRIYRRHKREGVQYNAPAATKGQKVAKWVALVLVIAILAGVMVLMFSGNITYTCTDTALQIEATYHENSVVAYDQIDSVELREGFDVGVRSMGFGSPRLSMGTFQNEECGDYTLYSYNSCDSMILIRSGNKWLAINCQTAEETAALYQTLLQCIGK